MIFYKLDPDKSNLQESEIYFKITDLISMHRIQFHRILFAEVQLYINWNFNFFNIMH